MEHASSITTKTGDNGTTGIFGGTRVSKSSTRLHAYGAVDELNAILGLVCTEKLPEGLAAQFRRTQHQLFRLGADLASTQTQTLHTQRMSNDDVGELEHWIKELEERLSPLKNFIVPGGCRAAALLHHARTVCRRAERWTIALAEKEHVNPQAHTYLNRLSDYLFLAARWVNHEEGIPDVIHR